MLASLSGVVGSQKREDVKFPKEDGREVSHSNILSIKEKVSLVLIPSTVAV